MRGFVAAPGLQVAIDAVVAGVDFGADEPFGPGHVPLENLVPRLEPIDGLSLLGPEGLWVGFGVLVDARIVPVGLGFELLGRADSGGPPGAGHRWSRSWWSRRSRAGLWPSVGGTSDGGIVSPRSANPALFSSTSQRLAREFRWREDAFLVGKVSVVGPAVFDARAVLRGDQNRIEIGPRFRMAAGSTIHVERPDADHHWQ